MSPTSYRTAPPRVGMKANSMGRSSVWQPRVAAHRERLCHCVLNNSEGPMIATGTVVSVNVGRPRSIEWFGRDVTTSIWKQPVDGPVAVAGVNLAGDDQADRRVHGGPEKAVYAYALEDYRWWRDVSGD